MTNHLTRTLVLMLLHVVCACKPNKSIDCRGITLKRVYINVMGTTNSTSYEHFVMFNNYKHECFAAVNFSALAKKYADTCTYRKPIKLITFLYSTEGINFESGEPDLTKTKEYELMSFMMDSTSIRKVYFIRDGIRKTIELGDCNFKETYYE